ncbi:MAG: hypothetical protein AB9880_05460 [Christensenellales bacterium]
MKYQEFKNNGAITPQRKMLYYGGMALIVIGTLLFLSVFVGMATSFGDFADFSEGSDFMLRGFVGIILIIAGSILRHIGAMGLAGSGVVLDPQRARDDLSPFAGALGGMARDAVDAFKGDKADVGEQAPQVMLRCRSCRALNREDAKYCDQCGVEL